MLIIDCGSQKTPFIEQTVDLEMDYKTVKLFDADKNVANDCQGIIISGAPILITEVDNQPYLDQLSWIKEVNIPVLGICFGHQILGLLYEANAARQKEDRDWQLIESLENHSILEKLPIEFEMMEDHCESISVPRDFKLLAVSDACVNEAMYHKSKPFFGVQFHPEVSGNQGSIIIENFVNICRKTNTEIQK